MFELLKVAAGSKSIPIVAGDACKLPTACTNTEAINDMKKFVSGSKKAAKANKVGSLELLRLPVLRNRVHTFTHCQFELKSTTKRPGQVISMAALLWLCANAYVPFRMHD